MEVGAGTLAPGPDGVRVSRGRWDLPGSLILGNLCLPWMSARQDLFFITTTNYPEEEEGKKQQQQKQPPNFFFFGWNLLLMADWLYIIKQAAGALPG